MKVYLAGSSHEKERACCVAEQLLERGHEVTSTWHYQTYVPGSDGGLSSEKQLDVALGCLAELEEADIVWVLWPATSSIGAYVEMGYALRAPEDADLIVTGPGVTETCFTSLAVLRSPIDHRGLLEVDCIAKAYGGCQ